jgi:UDP-N-acetyl-D-mannosaminuronic acid transferase (WecB/TagA/CpsF family)
MAREIEGLHACFCGDGCSDVATFDDLAHKLLERKPHIVILGMGQPLQEKVVI